MDDGEDTKEKQDNVPSTSVARPFKVCNKDRNRKIGVVASSYEELKRKFLCQHKFSIEEETGVRFIMEDDGTEVDSEFLWTVQSGATLMVLQNGENWNRVAPPSGHAGSVQNADITMSIIESLREENKKKRTTKQLQENKKSKLYTVHVGWMNYSYRDQKYRLIKASRDNDSGPRSLKFDGITTLRDIRGLLIATFFPNRRSCFGPQKRYNFAVGTFDGHEIDESKKLHEYVAGSVKPRLYLLSKEIACWTIQSDSDTDSDFLPDIRAIKRSRGKEPAQTVTSQEAAMTDFGPDIDFLTGGTDFINSQGGTVSMTASMTDSSVSTQSAGNSTVNNFLGTGQHKFSIEEETGVRFIMEDDGTEVDSEFLWTVQSGATLMVLQNGENWNRVAPPSGHAGSVQNADITMSIIESLREENKKKRTTKQLQENKKSKLYTVHVGWMNYSYRDQKYRLIKASRDNDSGPRSLKFDGITTLRDIRGLLIATFFPNRRSCFGPQKRYNFAVGTFDGHEIDESKKLHEYVAGSVKPRLYLLSKEIACWTIQSDSDTDSDFLPDIRAIKRSRGKEPAQTVTSQEAAMTDFGPDIDFLTGGTDFINSQGGTVSMTASMTDSSVSTQSAGNSTVNNFLGTGQQADAPQDALSPYVDSGTPTVSLKPKVCIVCFDREPTAFYYPCGHTSCLPCALHIFESTIGKKCPNCRGKVESVRNIYSEN